jgi:hypothetical protein
VGARTRTHEGVTVTEVLELLDPPMPRGTMGRLVLGLRPIGVRPPAGSGRPGHAYHLDELLEIHRRWADRKFAKASADEANSR